eukprot:1799901-Rhodomonas_salina.1
MLRDVALGARRREICVDVQPRVERHGEARCEGVEQRAEGRQPVLAQHQRPAPHLVKPCSVAALVVLVKRALEREERGPRRRRWGAVGSAEGVGERR